MQVACLRCLPARKPLRRFSTLRRFPPFLACRTPVRSISDTHPVDIGHRSGPNRTPFRSHQKTVRHQPGRLSGFNRNAVRFESERCPTSNRIGVRFASEYATPAGNGAPHPTTTKPSVAASPSSSASARPSTSRASSTTRATGTNKPSSSSPPISAPNSTADPPSNSATTASNSPSNSTTRDTPHRKSTYCIA